jgi:NAD dependent epimerase/dehydratase family enzyme
MTSNAEFMRILAKILRRPYWFPVPAFLMRIVLGEMSVLVTEGRFSRPERLFELGYNMRFKELEEALRDIFMK